MRRLLFLGSMVTALFAAGCGESHDPGGVGAACGAGCAEGLSCVRGEGYVDGYCTAICEDGACPAEAVCEASSTPPLCLARCASAAECRDGYQCWRGACRPRCASDGDCGAGGTCMDGACGGAECVDDGDCGPTQRCASARCVALTDGGATLPPGAECARHEECLGGVCLPPELGGFCSIACADADACFELPVAVETGCTALALDGAVRTVCATFPADGQPMGAACGSDADCDARLCQEGQCTEVCDDDGDCLPGQTCRALPRAGVSGGTYMGCGYTDRAGTVTIEEHDLGELDLRAGFLGELALGTPPDAVSLTLQAQRVSGDPLELSFVSVSDPAGASVFDVQEIFELRDQPIRWLPIDTGAMITMLVPNTTPDRVAYLGGRHAWDVTPLPRMMGDTGSSRVRLTALVKRAVDGIASSGSLDLNVHFVSGVGPGASAAPGNSKMQGTLSRLSAILSAAGVGLGTVRYFDVADSGLRVIDTTDGSDSELSQLFRQSAARSGRAVNIFFVDSIEAPSGGFGALGVAGGIPGPVGIHGTEHSGVAATWSGLDSGTLGHVLAHEIGHYVGLFHSTENARPCGPGESPATVDCAPFGGGDQLVDTSHGDSTNLMYWSIVGGGSNDRVSAGQGFVYRASAAVGP